MSRVLAAITDTVEDQQAVEEALGLLKADHAYLFLTVDEGAESIVPLTATATPVLPPVVTLDSKVFEQIDHQAQQEGQDYLRRLVDRLQIKAHVRVETGDPAERICAVASEQNVDLIVIGSSDSNLLQRILRGSISDQVAHRAPCPVLLIRRNENDNRPGSNP